MPGLGPGSVIQTTLACKWEFRTRLKQAICRREHAACPQSFGESIPMKKPPKVRYLLFEVHRDIEGSHWAKETLLSVIEMLDAMGFDPRIS